MVRVVFDVVSQSTVYKGHHLVLPITNVALSSIYGSISWTTGYPVYLVTRLVIWMCGVRGDSFEE